MTPQRWARLEEVFLGAIDLSDDQRDTFIAQQCSDHPSLAADVRQLLADHDRAGEFIEPLPKPADSDPPVAGRRLGAYTLVRILASGGMGTVYEAVQDSPRRSVALKVLRAGLASPGLLRRFREESAILARLQHPGIAQVYEAGATDDAGGPVPYFAMELVEGASTITAFALEKQLPAVERLGLFLTVCDAVQHAHQKGVIHRDLKPGNILIDGAGHPKVIDFGVARALRARTNSTMLSDAHTLVGTVAYMSPEQCDPAADADVRADVYSLGVVLYELLCGTLPYAVENIPLSEATRIIREQPPRRLSAIRPTLRGDLETIVLKALEKDRDRRYQSVADLAADIRRFLSRQPISARPPTLTYHVLKLVARNKLASGFALAVLLGSLVFVVTVTVLYARADAARVRAQAAELEALDQRNRSQAAGREIISMLQGLDPNLTIASADRAEEGSQSPLEILDRCNQSLGHMLGTDPAMHADALMAVALQYWRYRAYERAYRSASEALDLRRREFGARHVSVAEPLAALSIYADRVSTPGEAESYCREAIAIYETNLPDHAADLVRVLERLSSMFRWHGDLGAALETNRRAYDIARESWGADDPRAAEVGIRLAGALPETERSWGERLLEQDVQRLRSALGEDDLRTLRAAASLCRFRSDHDGLERLLRRIITVRREALGPDHPEVADELLGLGRAMVFQGRPASSMGPFLEALAIRQKVFGARSLKTAEALGTVAQVHYLAGDFDQAVARQRESMSIIRTLLGDDHVDTASAGLQLATLSGTHSAGPDLADLLAYASGHYERTRRLEVGHPLHSGGPLLLGITLLRCGRDAEAERFLSEAFEIRHATFTPRHPMAVYAAGMLAACRAHLGCGDEAVAALAGAHAELKSTLGARHLRSVELLRWIVEVNERCGRADAARSAREELDGLLDPEQLSRHREEPAPD